MKKVSITIHNGRISGVATGYMGKGCDAPIRAVEEALGGRTVKDEETAEANMTEDPLCQDSTAVG